MGALTLTYIAYVQFGSLQVWGQTAAYADAPRQRSLMVRMSMLTKPSRMRIFIFTFPVCSVYIRQINSVNSCNFTDDAMFFILLLQFGQNWTYFNLKRSFFSEFSVMGDIDKFTESIQQFHTTITSLSTRIDALEAYPS